MPALLLLLLAAVALSGCETTQEKSAKLEREAHEREHHSISTKVVSVPHRNPSVEVLTDEVLSSREGSALAVRLRNRSSKPIVDAPIEVTIVSASGSTLYTNATPDLAVSLRQAPLLAPHAEATWVDDQVQLSGKPAKVSVLVGEGIAPPSTPAVEIERFSRIEGGQGVTGTVLNESGVEQRELVVYGLARRGGRIVAAGRGIVPELKAHASAQFNLYLTGDAKGASVTVSAPPTSF